MRRTAYVTLLGAIAGLVLAFGLASLIDARLTKLVLEEAASRAVDQVELSLLERLTPEDFDPPYTAAKLEDLESRMAPQLARLRAPGSGLIRVNVLGRDGTILYSDKPGIRGRVAPASRSGFATALAGQVSSEDSSLSSVENSDLKDHYQRAVEVYVPLDMDGRVVAVYEIYQDLGPVTSLRVVVWLVVAVAMSLLFGVLGHTLATRQARRPPNEVSVVDVPGINRLTPRELEVLRLMAGSYTYRDMAEALVVSEETVRSHVKSILRKLNQRDRTQAVITAVKAGLLQLP